MKFIWRCQWPIFHCHWYIRACLSGGWVCSRRKLHGAHTVELNLEPSQVGNDLPRNITARQARWCQSLLKSAEGLIKQEALPDALRLSGLQGTQLIEFAGFVGQIRRSRRTGIINAHFTASFTVYSSITTGNKRTDTNQPCPERRYSGNRKLLSMYKHKA